MLDLLQGGLLLPDVMAMVGWRDLDSVKRYSGLPDEDRLKKAVEAAWATSSRRRNRP